MTPEEREALLAGYALGTLSDPDARDAERLIRTEPAAEREHQAYRDLADLIALSVPLRHPAPDLRERIIAAARRSRPFQSRRYWRRYVPAAAIAAAFALVSMWAISLQATIGDMRQDQAALAAVVEASAKRLEALNDTAADQQRTETLGSRFETAVRDQQVILAVQSDPEARRTNLEPTGAAHGAHGTYLWSDANAAGVLLVYDLPTLGLGESYKLWLEDSASRMVFSTGFTPDLRGDATVSVTLEEQREPVRLYLVASNVAGTDGPVVLQSVLNRDANAAQSLPTR